MTELERVIKENKKLQKEILVLKGIEDDKDKKSDKIKVSFSKVTDKKLKECVNIKQKFKQDIFENWFNSNYKITKDIETFLSNLINKYGLYLSGYKEENLKANFIIPILNKIDFLSSEYECAGLYEENLYYETEKFIFSGTTDFVVAKGLVEAEKPYFFIQEFKRNEENSFPRTQLVAELISSVEINNWTTIKGCYIIGAIWNFVILERFKENDYQYFVSKNFDSTKIEDLKDIFRNLLFVKDEIFEFVKGEMNDK